MKAISLWQPWASLWLSGRKIHETRCWSTSYRGPLYIHAAKRNIALVDPRSPLEEILIDEFGGHWGMDLPTGAIIGVINLVDCFATERMHAGHDVSDDYWCGDFGRGRFAWRGSAPRLFERPIPYRGRQRIFNVVEDIVGRAAA